MGGLFSAAGLDTEDADALAIALATFDPKGATAC